MSENTHENQEVKVCPKCKHLDLSKMSTCEILRMAFYEFWGSYPEKLAKDRRSSSHNANQVNETLNM